MPQPWCGHLEVKFPMKICQMVHLQQAHFYPLEVGVVPISILPAGHDSLIDLNLC
jgi:hypothetical protein